MSENLEGSAGEAVSMEDLGAALSAEFNIDGAGEAPVVEPAPAEEAEPAGEAALPFHDPISGKSFATEIELVRHENGRKANENGELRRRLEELEAKALEPVAGEAKQLTRDEIKAELFRDLVSPDELNDPVVEIQYGVAERIVNAMEARAAQREAVLVKEINELKSRFSEGDIRTKTGFDAKAEARTRDYLEKNPAISEAIKSQPRDKQIAMLAEINGMINPALAGGVNGAAVPRPDPAQHVEGSSAVSSKVEKAEGNFDEMDLDEMFEALKRGTIENADAFII